MIKTQAAPAVGQDTLEQILFLRSEVTRLQSELRTLEDTTIEQLNSGRGIVSGRFAAILGTWQRRAVSWKQVVVNLRGLDYAARILDRTPFETHYRLDIVPTDSE